MFEITEQEAVGEIAEIYKDIRETLDMPFVNTIWRNLATHGDALQWVWYSLKPIYASGAVAHYASELQSSLDISWILQMPDPAFNIIRIGEQDRQHMCEFLDNMNFGNSQNIIGLSALYTHPSEHNITQALQEPEKRQYSNLPPLIDPDSLKKDEKELFDIIDQIGQEVSVGFPPALLRGLARWPKLLPVIWNILSMIEADGRLEKLKNKTRDKVFESSATLANHINRIPQPEKGTQILLQLKKLTQGGIPRMLPVGLILYRLLSR